VKREETMSEDKERIEEEAADNGDDSSRVDQEKVEEKAAGNKQKKRKSKKGSGEEDERDLMDLIQHKNMMLEKMKERIEQLEEEVEKKEDRILRMVAEFDNYKKRIIREQDLQQDKMYAEILREILPVLDDFDRALEMETDEDGSFREGIELVYRSFRDILERLGLNEIPAEGRKFDPRVHEAMGTVESERDEGEIAHVVLKGYQYNDMVIRPARVMVSGGNGSGAENAE
jgi:molecular chaperone GrpE